MAKLPMSASPEITPSRMFFAGRSVPPGNVCTLIFPPVLFSTSLAQCSIWTQGKVGAGGKLAYGRVVAFVSAAGAGDGESIAMRGRQAKRNRMSLKRMSYLLDASMRLDIWTPFVIIGKERTAERRTGEI